MNICDKTYLTNTFICNYIKKKLHCSCLLSKLDVIDHILANATLWMKFNILFFR